MTGSEVHRANAARRMDALSFNFLHLLIFAALGLGLMFDQMESSMSAILVALFSEQGSGVDRQSLSTMLTAYFVVAALGAPLMGALADRIGRRVVLIITFASFGLLTIIAAHMPDFTGFAVVRVVSSFAISAIPALVFIYIADTLPPAARGTTMMLIGVLAGLGAVLAPFVTHWGNNARPFGLEGWQAGMVLGGAMGVILALVAFVLPESPRWLAARGRQDAAERALERFENSRSVRARTRAAAIPDATIAARDIPVAGATDAALSGATIRDYRGRLALIVTIMFLQSCGLTGFAILLTKVLVMKGMSMQAALAQSSLILLAHPVGVITFATITDRINRRTLFVVMALILAIGATTFGIAQDKLLLASGILCAFLSSAHASLIQIYSAEMFPTAIRGTAMGFGYAAVRTGSGCVPILLLPLLLDHGPVLAFGVIGAFLGAAAIIAQIWGPSIIPRKHLA